ncbi:MAG: lipopolysaccharide biosynthesis protein [Pyrinomonadaceae bacterium]
MLATETIVASGIGIAEREGAPRMPVRDKALTHKAYLNGIASLLDTVVKGGVMTLVTPILVTTLGSSLFGVWQILGRLVVYMQAADGRPTQALKWVIANRQTIDDAETKRRHVGSAVGVWLLFLPVLAVMSVALVWVAPYMARVPLEMYTPVRVACTLLVVNFLLLQLVDMPEAVLRGMNLGYKRMGLQAGLNVVGGALSVGALYLGAGLIGLAAADTILSTITCILFFLVVKKYVAWFGIARPTFAEMRSFLKLSVWWLAWTTIHKFIMASDLLILGIVASTSAVATYSLTAFASLTLLTFVTTVIGAVIPGLGSVVGQKQYERAAALRVEMMAASWLLLAAIGSTILLWNRSFVYLWVGKQHYAGLWPNLLIVLMVVQLIFIRNDAYVIDLTLQLREKVLMGAIAAIVSIALSTALIPRLGITGLCLGMLAGRMALTVSYPLIIRKRFARIGRPRLSSVARPAVTMILLFAVSAYLGQMVVADHWVIWVFCSGLSFAVATGLALMLGLKRDLRISLMGRLSMARTLFGFAGRGS